MTLRQIVHFIQGYNQWFSINLPIYGYANIWHVAIVVVVGAGVGVIVLPPTLYTTG